MSRIHLPRVSIIIPVCNDVHGIKQTLTALKAQDYPKDKLEIIVVDNNSSDGSDKIAATFRGITVTYEKNIQNAGAARNKALTIATGEIIAFTDADCIPKNNWITEGVMALENKQVDRIAGQIVIEPVTPESSAAAILDGIYNFNQRVLIKAYHAAITANLFVKRFVFEKIGLFHTDYFEDIEFNRRASSAGFTLAYAPKCVVIHPPRQTLNAVWKKGKKKWERRLFNLSKGKLRKLVGLETSNTNSQKFIITSQTILGTFIISQTRAFLV